MPYKSQQKKKNHNKTYYRMSTNEIQQIADYIESQQNKGRDFSYKTVKQHFYLTLQLESKQSQKEVRPINQTAEPPKYAKCSNNQLKQIVQEKKESIIELNSEIVACEKILEQRSEFTYHLASNYRSMMQNDLQREKALIALQNENDANEFQQQMVLNMVNKRPRLAEPEVIIKASAVQASPPTPVVTNAEPVITGISESSTSPTPTQPALQSVFTDVINNVTEVARNAFSSYAS
jgi:hypothetical protein